MSFNAVTRTTIPFSPTTANDANAPCPIASLPTELLARIFVLLTDPLDQESIKSVCKHFYLTSSCNYVQRELVCNRLEDAIDFKNALNEVGSIKRISEIELKMLANLYASFKKNADKVFVKYPFLQQIYLTFDLLEKKFSETGILSSANCALTRKLFFKSVFQDVFNERIQIDGIALFEPSIFYQTVKKMQNLFPNVSEETIAPALLKTSVINFYNVVVTGHVHLVAQAFFGSLILGGNFDFHFLLFIASLHEAVENFNNNQNLPLARSLLELTLRKEMLSHTKLHIGNHPNATQLHAFLDSQILNVKSALLNLLARDCNPLAGYEANDLEFVQRYNRAVRFYCLEFNADPTETKNLLNRYIHSHYAHQIVFLNDNLINRRSNLHNNPKRICEFALRQIREENIQAKKLELEKCEARTWNLLEKLTVGIFEQDKRTQNKFSALIETNTQHISILKQQLETLQKSPEFPKMPEHMDDREQANITEIYNKTLNQWDAIINLLHKISLN